MLGGADRVVASGGGHRRFFIIYRFVEDYLPVPTIICAVVKVSALATVPPGGRVRKRPNAAKLCSSRR